MTSPTAQTIEGFAICSCCGVKCMEGFQTFKNTVGVFCMDCDVPEGWTPDAAPSASPWHHVLVDALDAVGEAFDHTPWIDDLGPNGVISVRFTAAQIRRIRAAQAITKGGAV